MDRELDESLEPEGQESREQIVKCSVCGKEHDLLDPTFRRPDLVAALAPEERAECVKESDDLCAVRGLDPDEKPRYFIRCVLNVNLLDADGESAWGLWAEVGEPEFRRIIENWSAPDQNRLPPMAAKLANRVPGYPETVGLPVSLQLTGTATRPELFVEADSTHPFAVECRSGVCLHQVMDWLRGMGSS